MFEDDFLEREIGDWQKYADILYQEDQVKFAEMMSEAKAYAKAAKNAPTKLPTEALFITLIF